MVGLSKANLYVDMFDLNIVPSEIREMIGGCSIEMHQNQTLSQVHRSDHSDMRHNSYFQAVVHNFSKFGSTISFLQNY